VAAHHADHTAEEGRQVTSVSLAIAIVAFIVAVWALGSARNAWYEIDELHRDMTLKVDKTMLDIERETVEGLAILEGMR